MSTCSSRFVASALIALLASVVQADAANDVLDLAKYKTVETAQNASLPDVLQRPGTLGPTYLGISLDPDNKQSLAVRTVDAESPAALAGIAKGDVIQTLDGCDVKSGESVRVILQQKFPGDVIRVGLLRGDKPVAVTLTLAPWSRPVFGPPGFRDPLGVQVAAAKDGRGVTIEQVTPGSPADRAKLKAGETLLKLGGDSLTGPDQLYRLLVDKKPSETLPLTLFLAEKTLEMKITLESEPRRGERTGGPGPRGTYWTKPSFRLALICVEYPDVKHNPKITKEAWDHSLFSRGAPHKTNITGQPEYGSMYDYYLEQSYGKFKLEGKVFDWVEVSKKRADYATGNRTLLLTEALDKLIARDGKDALKGFDGVFFLYAGARFPAARGSLYWAHRANVSHGGRRWPYFICDEGGPRMQGISVFCHEFGHMLGLPDLYARPESPGMEGAGVWCAMSQQSRLRPQHYCAWSKEKMGWIKPAVINPAIKQKLVLAPIEDSPQECFKVLIRPDGSEYLLLENRKKKGFDESLPAEGLLIWRVVGNRPFLQESHGIEGAAGPNAFRGDVPYPSTANDSYTPYTTPSSRSPHDGGYPVHITAIRRRADGRITFEIGYEYQ
jgi:M6 family metalloprotease-like protein